VAIKFEKVKPGMVLYDNHRTKMGNTTMSRMGEWPVFVREIDAERQRALVSWNCNPAQWYDRRRVEKLFATPLAERKKKREEQARKKASAAAARAPERP
jgi:hypothetical protein